MTLVLLELIRLNINKLMNAPSILQTINFAYVGENHTNFADHLLQLRIIEALYKKNPLLAIGMEMFPASAQPTLDRYTLKKESIDEKTFLKESDYYQAWSYDYRFYRDIFNFAKAFN